MWQDVASNKWFKFSFFCFKSFEQNRSFASREAVVHTSDFFSNRWLLWHPSSRVHPPNLPAGVLPGHFSKMLSTVRTALSHCDRYLTSDCFGVDQVLQIGKPDFFTCHLHLDDSSFLERWSNCHARGHCHIHRDHEVILVPVLGYGTWMLGFANEKFVAL